MAKNVIAFSVDYVCDCCGCSCATAPAASAQGIRSTDGRVQAFSLDLCGECAAEFDTWLASQRAIIKITEQ